MGSKLRIYTLWEETKSLSDWAKDSRCKYTYNGLIARVNRGLPLEEAMGYYNNEPIKRGVLFN